MWGPNWEAGHAPQQEASPVGGDEHFWTTLHTHTHSGSPTHRPPPPPSPPDVLHVPPLERRGAPGTYLLARRDLRRRAADCRELAAPTTSQFASPPRRLSWWLRLSIPPRRRWVSVPFPLQSPVPPSSAHAGIEAPCTSMPCSVVFPFSIKRPCLPPPRAAPLLPWHETCSRLWPSAARAPSSSTEQPLLSIPVPRRPVPRTYHLSRYLSPTASYFVETGPNSARLFLPVPAVLMHLARRVQICLSTLVARALCA